MVQALWLSCLGETLKLIEQFTKETCFVFVASCRKTSGIDIHVQYDYVIVSTFVD